jgi:hypothetical protein
MACDTEAVQELARGSLEQEKRTTRTGDTKVQYDWSSRDTETRAECRQVELELEFGHWALPVNLDPKSKTTSEYASSQSL